VLIYDSGEMFAQSVAVGDVNRDGRFGHSGGERDSVAALLGNGDGTFQPAVTFEAIGFHRFIVIADI
jgi:hypothetical protein